MSEQDNKRSLAKPFQPKADKPKGKIISWNDMANAFYYTNTSDSYMHSFYKHLKAVIYDGCIPVYQRKKQENKYGTSSFVEVEFPDSFDRISNQGYMFSTDDLSESFKDFLCFREEMTGNKDKIVEKTSSILSKAFSAARDYTDNFPELEAINSPLMNVKQRAPQEQNKVPLLKR